MANGGVMATTTGPLRCAICGEAVRRGRTGAYGHRARLVAACDLERNKTEETDVLVQKVIERKNPRDGQTVIGSRKNSQGQTVYLIEANDNELQVKANAMVSIICTSMIPMAKSISN